MVWVAIVEPSDEVFLTRRVCTFVVKNDAVILPRSVYPFKLNR